MFGVPSVGKTASLCILRESQSAELLEEVDEDDLTLDMGFSSEQTKAQEWTTLLSVAVLVVSCCVTLQLFPLIAIMSIFMVSGYLVWIVGKWRLETFVQKLSELDVVAHKANRALLQREMLSFGLGLSTSQALSSCRLHVFACCQENVRYLSSLADRLASAEFMAEERRRLMSSFYTEEMKDLVGSSADSDSSHITQRGVGALLDLFVLHRSEILRLLVLYLFRSPLRSTLTLLVSVFFGIHREIDSHIERCRVIINTLSRKRSREAKAHSSLEVRKVNELDTVAFALEDVITGITSGDLTADEVKRALQRVLSMKAFVNSKTKHAEALAEELELADRPDVTGQRAVAKELAPPAPLCDEVYEVIASHDGVEPHNVHSFEDDDCSVERSRELMDELRMALAGRAVEFAARERKALAAFYGVSDAELEELEKSQKREQSPTEVAHVEKPTEALYESPDHGEELNDEWTPVITSSEQNRARTLPPDLLSALRMRSVAEEVIGDVDD